jgi:hypothetical protein
MAYHFSNRTCASLPFGQKNKAGSRETVVPKKFLQLPKGKQQIGINAIRLWATVISETSCQNHSDLYVQEIINLC